MSQKKSWLTAKAEFALAGSLLQTLRMLPLPMANSAAQLSARLLDAIVPKLRKTARTNLAFAYPAMSQRERDAVIDGVFRSISRLMVSLARFPDLNPGNISEWISYDGLANYLNAKAQGRGVLVATAHLGNWELSAFAHAFLTEPMNIMVRPLDNPLIDGLVERRRVLSGNRLIYKQDAARSVIRALRNNEAVGVLLDQNTAAEGVFVDFFGKLACASSVFVKLAYHAGAPIIPGFALWNQSTQRYTLRFLPALELTGNEQRDNQAIHTAIESVIREYPDQWLWIHRRWKTRPAGEQPLY